MKCVRQRYKYSELVKVAAKQIGCDVIFSMADINVFISSCAAFSTRACPFHDVLELTRCASGHSSVSQAIRGVFNKY